MCSTLELTHTTDSDRGCLILSIYHSSDILTPFVKNSHSMQYLAIARQNLFLLGKGGSALPPYEVEGSYNR